MAEEAKATEDVFDEMIKLPEYMIQVPDIFNFRFIPFDKLAQHFGTNGDLFTAIQSLRNHISNSDLPPEDITQICKLLDEEVEVISFSQSTRRGVIGL